MTRQDQNSVCPPAIVYSTWHTTLKEKPRFPAFKGGGGEIVWTAQTDVARLLHFQKGEHEVGQRGERRDGSGKRWG